MSVGGVSEERRQWGTVGRPLTANEKLSIATAKVDAEERVGEAEAAEVAAAAEAARRLAQQHPHLVKGNQSSYDAKTSVAVSGNSSLTAGSTQSVGAASSAGASSVSIDGNQTQIHVVQGKGPHGVKLPSRTRSAGTRPLHLGMSTLMSVHTHDREGFMQTAAHAARKDPFASENAA